VQALLKRRQRPSGRLRWLRVLNVHTAFSSASCLSLASCS
jgi:hypothetical protein